MLELLIGMGLIWMLFFILALIAFGELGNPIAGSFLFMFIANWPMAIVRWFLTDHFSFWAGFKELLWALCPLLNIGYVWDWWFNIAMFFGLFITRLGA